MSVLPPPAAGRPAVWTEGCVAASPPDGSVKLPHAARRQAPRDLPEGCLFFAAAPHFQQTHSWRGDVGSGGTAEAGLGHEPGGHGPVWKDTGRLAPRPGRAPWDAGGPAGWETERGLRWEGHPPVDREHFKAVDVQHTNDGVLAVPAGVPAPGFHDAVDPVHHPLEQPLVHRLREASCLLQEGRLGPPAHRPLGTLAQASRA